MKLEPLRRAKSAEEISELIAPYSRPALAALIFSLVKTERHYTAEEIAELEGMHAATIRRDIKAGLFGGEYFARNTRQLRVSASGLAAWRDMFRVKVAKQ